MEGSTLIVAKLAYEMAATTYPEGSLQKISSSDNTYLVFNLLAWDEEGGWGKKYPNSDL